MDVPTRPPPGCLVVHAHGHAAVTGLETPSAGIVAPRPRQGPAFPERRRFPCNVPSREPVRRRAPDSSHIHCNHHPPRRSIFTSSPAPGRVTPRKPGGALNSQAGTRAPPASRAQAARFAGYFTRRVSVGSIRVARRAGSQTNTAAARPSFRRHVTRIVRSPSTFAAWQQPDSLGRTPASHEQFIPHSVMRYNPRLDHRIQVSGDRAGLARPALAPAAGGHPAYRASQAALSGCGRAFGGSAGAARQPSGGLEGRPRRTAQHTHQPAMADLLSVECGERFRRRDCRLSLTRGRHDTDRSRPVAEPPPR